MAQSKKPTVEETNESSQTKIQNFEAQKLSETNPAKFMEMYNKNDITLSGKVVAKEISEGQIKIDKKTNAPVLDNNGQPEKWDPFYSCEIIFEGGSIRMNVQKDMHEKLDIGKRYMFSGMMGLEFKKVQPKFYNAVLIA